MTGLIHWAWFAKSPCKAVTLILKDSFTENNLNDVVSIHAAALPYQCWDKIAITGILAVPHHHIRIAVIDEKAQGFIIWRAVLDEAELLTIAVNPDMKRHKIGSLLLSAMLADISMKPVKQCFLEVAEDNIAAQQFYERFDFTEFSRRKKYYQRPDSNRIDAILMRRIFA